MRWSEHNPPNPTKLLYRHVWRPIPYSLQTVIVDDLTNPAYIRHCTLATGSFEEEEVGLTRTRLPVTTCTLVSRYVHLYTHATSIQSYVQGDKHLDLPDTTIHGVTEQTRPDMWRLHFRCCCMLHVQNQSVSKFLCGINGCRSTPHHRMSGS